MKTRRPRCGASPKSDHYRWERSGSDSGAAFTPLCEITDKAKAAGEQRKRCRKWRRSGSESDAFEIRVRRCDRENAKGLTDGLTRQCEAQIIVSIADGIIRREQFHIATVNNAS